MIDQYGRKIDYLRISVTDRCNLRCKYCMPVEGIQKRTHEATLRNEDFLKIAKVMVGLGVDKIRLTGGEPLVRKGLPSLISALNELPGVQDISMTTNGIYLADQMNDLVHSGLKRVNISLDSLNPDTYRDLTRGGDLKNALKGISSAIEHGLFPVKLNVVLINEVNTEEIESFLDIAESGIIVRFIELMPMGEAASWAKNRFADASAIFDMRNDLLPFPEYGDGGPCRYYKRVGGKGIIGVISPISQHFCYHCNRLRITSDGLLRTCLHSDHAIDLKPFLENEEELIRTISQETWLKPNRHRLQDAGAILSSCNMNRIGG